MSLHEFIEDSFGTIGEINYENGYIEFEILEVKQTLTELGIYNKEDFVVHVSFNAMLDFVILTVHKSGKLYFLEHYKYKVIEE